MLSAKRKIGLLAAGIAVFFLLLGTVSLQVVWKRVVKLEVKSCAEYADQVAKLADRVGFDDIERTIESVNVITPLEEAKKTFLYLVADSTETVMCPAELRGFSLKGTQTKPGIRRADGSGGWEADIWGEGYDVVVRPLAEPGYFLYALYNWFFIYEAYKDAILIMISVIAVLMLVVTAVIVFVIIPTVSTISRKRREAERELEIAAEVQRQALPQALPEGCDAYAFFKAMKEVGGDLYNWCRCGEWIYLAVGDISGKGMQAAFQMVSISSMAFSGMSAGKTPDEILGEVNAQFLGPAERFGAFCTMFVCRINLRTREFQYSNAGHMKAIVNGRFLDQDAGLPLGLDADMKYTLQSADLPEGSTIIQYTDGLTEALNASGEFYGTKRLLESARRADGSARQTAESLVADVESFLQGAEASDDMAIITLKI